MYHLADEHARVVPLQHNLCYKSKIGSAWHLGDPYKHPPGMWAREGGCHCNTICVIKAKSDTYALCLAFG